MDFGRHSPASRIFRELPPLRNNPSFHPGKLRPLSPMSSTPITPPVTRRHFIHLAGAAGAGVLGFPAILRSQSPNRRLNVAVIGVGGRGGSNLAGVAGENIVALCDVNAKNLQAAAAKSPAL